MSQKELSKSLEDVGAKQLSMSLKQCSGCAEMVDESKAYCPDCGTPMDEEQRRSNEASEFDSLMKTQNINVTSHLKMIEQFNLSSAFPPPQVADEPAAAKKEPGAVKRETKTVQLQAIPEISTKQPHNTAFKSEQESSLSSNRNAVAGNTSDSKKTLYIVGGLVLLLLALGFAAAVTFGILYWFNK